MKLLMSHIQEQHNVGWYASELCVTPQYLNRVVKSTSQKTAYEHICTMLIGAIREQLENTDDSVSKIADDFHFVDLSTMTKFFKRKMGKTPTEYRKSL
ncbi:MAG: helix-turn-helix domain-containing protein [Muribaculaceae bacterium]